MFTSGAKYIHSDLKIYVIISLCYEQGGYGMTETSPISFLSLPTDTNDKVASTAGYIIEHVEVCIKQNFCNL